MKTNPSKGLARAASRRLESSTRLQYRTTWWTEELTPAWCPLTYTNKHTLHTHLTHTCTQTHTCRHTFRDTQTHEYICTETHTYRYTFGDTDTQRQALSTHTQGDAHTERQTDTDTQTHEDMWGADMAHSSGGWGHLLHLTSNRTSKGKCPVGGRSRGLLSWVCAVGKEPATRKKSRFWMPSSTQCRLLLDRCPQPASSGS